MQATFIPAPETVFVLAVGGTKAVRNLVPKRLTYFPDFFP